MWDFYTASYSHITGKRAHCNVFEGVYTTQRIRGVAPNILSRIDGTGSLGLVTEVEGEALVSF